MDLITMMILTVTVTLMVLIVILMVTGLIKMRRWMMMIRMIHFVFSRFEIK